MEIIHKVYYAVGAILIGLASIAYFYKQFYSKRRKNISLRPAQKAFDYLDIQLFTSDVGDIISNLRTRSEKYKAIGFDCEWVSGKGGRRPVSLLQLSTFDGYCALFRLHLMNTIPTELKELLSDRHLYKVGVAPRDDAKYLRKDYHIQVKSTLDVNHLVELSGGSGGGLAQLTQTLLHVTLDKRRKTRCSDWEVPELSPSQIHYAASDAHAAMLIFVHTMNKFNTGFRLPWNKGDVWDRVHEICDSYTDTSYKIKNKVLGTRKERIGKKLTPTTKKHSKGLPTRTKPLYDNCYLKAPDGELLCTCDTKKARWYVSKGLADMESEEPMTVRLRFEPAARSVGEVGRFYQIEKQNKCVVCGDTNSFIRKNVVPREYRKFFPELMKANSSHDILLLCSGCHQRSNTADQSLRYRLAEMCDAPISSIPQFSEERDIKLVRTAARALLFHGRRHILPAHRRKELEAIILNYYTDYSQLTDELLEQAGQLYNMKLNIEFQSEKHGKKVVDHFMQMMERGLLELETMWRQHFLQVMEPLYLPELWSVTHNEERIFVKYKEGRINDDDLKTIGLKNCNWSSTNQDLLDEINVRKAAKEFNVMNCEDDFFAKLY